MKIKFPKSVLIGSNNFRVIADKNRDDAEFYYWNKESNGSFLPPTIVIGTKYIDIMPIQVLSNIIHELKEIIQVEQQTRVILRDGSEEYHYKHKEHTDLCSRLAGLLSLFLE